MIQLLELICVLVYLILALYGDDDDDDGDECLLQHAAVMVEDEN